MSNQGGSTQRVRSSKVPLWAIGLVLVLMGSWLAHAIQTTGGVRIQDVRFTGTNGTAMSGLLYIPKNATAKTPAPGILAIHGYFNSREAQDGFAIEFSRRGYVVLALDQTGHGFSEPPAFANQFGGPDGLRYLRSLDIVDQNNIGLEGHSMGGWAITNAAAAFPEGYKAIVLEGSSVGAPFAPEGTTTFPRNLAVVFSKLDEFSGIMWHVPRADVVTSSPKLMSIFATTTPVQPGQVYGDINAGTARVLYTPGGTHPMDHISTTAIGHAVEWMGKTLQGGSPIPADNQIWYWKEIGTLIALIGFAIFVIGLLGALLQAPCFASLSATPTPLAGARHARAMLLIGTLVSAVAFLPLCRLGGEIFPASHWFAQKFNNEFIVWALFSAALIAMLGKVAGLKHGATRSLPPVAWRAFLLCVTVFAVGYALNSMADFIFKVDFRIWFMALKPMSQWQARAFVVYFPLLLLFFWISQRNLNLLLDGMALSQRSRYTWSILATTGGMALFLIIQYALLVTQHTLITFHDFDPLRIIMAINLLVLLPFAAIISTYSYLKTARHFPGACLSSLLVSWYMVVGQATQAV